MEQSSPTNKSQASTSKLSPEAATALLEAQMRAKQMQREYWQKNFRRRSAVVVAAFVGTLLAEIMHFGFPLFSLFLLAGGGFWLRKTWQEMYGDGDMSPEGQQALRQMLSQARTEQRRRVRQAKASDTERPEPGTDTNPEGDVK